MSVASAFSDGGSHAAQSDGNFLTALTDFAALVQVVQFHFASPPRPARPGIRVLGDSGCLAAERGRWRSGASFAGRRRLQPLHPAGCAQQASSTGPGFLRCEPLDAGMCCGQSSCEQTPD